MVKWTGCCILFLLNFPSLLCYDECGLEMDAATAVAYAYK